MNVKKIIAIPLMTAFSGVVLAAPPDLTPLTDSVDFSTTTTAVLAIAGLMAGVYLAIKGAKIVLRMVRGA